MYEKVMLPFYVQIGNWFRIRHHGKARQENKAHGKRTKRSAPVSRDHAQWTQTMLTQTPDPDISSPPAIRGYRLHRQFGKNSLYCQPRRGCCHLTPLTYLPWSNCRWKKWSNILLQRSSNWYVKFTDHPCSTRHMFLFFLLPVGSPWRLLRN